MIVLGKFCVRTNWMIPYLFQLLIVSGKNISHHVSCALPTSNRYYSSRQFLRGLCLYSARVSTIKFCICLDSHIILSLCYLYFT